MSTETDVVEERQRVEALRLRSEEGWGFQRIAREVGVSRTTVHRWWRGAGGEIKSHRSRIVDPIPAAPFLAWFDGRVKRIEHEINYPMIGGREYGGARERLVMELFPRDTSTDTGMRRLHRMRHGESHRPASGLASRAVIEDALWMAGVHIYELYPELEAVDAGRCVAV